ncbi:MAG: hypothetical protein U0670_03510 [Anaerolineae bacterium]
MNAWLQGTPSRLQKYLFWLHTLAFGAASIAMIIHGLASPSMLQGQPFAVTLIWGLIYVAHRGGYMYVKGRSEAPKDDRQAYREGLRDGIHEAMALQMQGRSPDRLMLDEDGELAVLVEAEKRKRR